ncbi:MAG: TonB-dependent receptor [Acidobacteriales bacterium]|nr:TonB-dependent receptor [Terriglobales bacterium]
MSLLCAGIIPAQVPVGQIFGVVRDPSGLVIPNATVTVEEVTTGQKFRVATNATGDFLVRSLPPGAYSVSGEAQGFKKAVRQGIAVSALQNVRVDLNMEVGTAAQSVVVTGDAPLVDTRSGTVGTLVDDKRIIDLPVSGRNMVQFINLAPGVGNIASANEGKANYNQQRVNINGNRIYSTNMQLDGASMYYAHRGQGILMPPPDAIEEVKVISSGMTAEYGRGTVVMSAVTKSGTNELHGSLYNFLRNDKLDARGFFDMRKAKLRQNQFGATAGAPILKNKLFFFASYEGTRIRQDASSTSMFPPGQAERNGDFTGSNPAPIDPTNKLPFPDRMIPTSRFDPVAVKLVQRMPLPTDPSGRLSSLQSQPATADNVIAKFDYAATDKDRLSFRYYFDYNRTVSVYPNNGLPAYAGASPTSMDPKSFTLNEVHVWSPSLLTVTHGSFTKFVYNELNAVHISLADLGATNFVDGCSTCEPRLPFLLVSGRFDANSARDQERVGPSYDFGQDWSWQRGRHELKWGAQTQRILFNRYADSYSSGRFTFDGSITKNPVADLMLGRSVKFTQNSNSVQSGLYYIPAFYVQDTWKVTPHLTLTLGLRWEIYTPWRDDQGQMATYITGVQSATFPTAPLGMVYQTDPQYNYNADSLNIGPRIGFAWDLFGDGKTAIRGGFGTSYDGVLGEVALSGNQPFSLGITNNNPGPLSNPYANMTNPFPYVVNPAKAVFTLPANPATATPAGLQAMYNYNINFTFERQLSPTWSVQTSYVGNLAHRLLNATEANPAIYGPGATSKNINARRPLAPLYTGFSKYTSDANSAYNAWQTIVTKRMGGGLSLQAHYSWSKAIDTCTNEVIGSCGQQDPANRNGSRGLGDFDHAHSAVISYVYGIPFFKSAPAPMRSAFAGWQLAGFHRLQTGAPFMVTTGSDVALTGVGYDRPDLVHTPSLPDGRSKQQELAQWFDTSAFVANQPGQYGNVGRNILRAPGLFTWDLSVQKNFPLFGERRKLQFRTDFMNIMNHANFAEPSAVLASPGTMGRITSTNGGARVVQLALRAEF